MKNPKHSFFCITFLRAVANSLIGLLLLLSVSSCQSVHSYMSNSYVVEGDREFPKHPHFSITNYIGQLNDESCRVFLTKDYPPYQYAGFYLFSSGHFAVAFSDSMIDLLNYDESLFKRRFLMGFYQIDPINHSFSGEVGFGNTYNMFFGQQIDNCLCLKRMVQRENLSWPARPKPPIDYIPSIVFQEYSLEHSLPPPDWTPAGIIITESSIDKR